MPPKTPPGDPPTETREYIVQDDPKAKEQGLQDSLHLQGLPSQLYDNQKKFLYSHEAVKLVELIMLHISKEELHENIILVKDHPGREDRPRLPTVFSSEVEEIEEINFPNIEVVKHNTIHDPEG